jgi:hypothetical protein
VAIARAVRAAARKAERAKNKERRRGFFIRTSLCPPDREDKGVHFNFLVSSKS